MCSEGKKNKQTNTHFEVLGYFSQQIFQKQKVAGMNLFVYAEAMWRLHSRAPHVDVWIWKARTARGRDRIRYNELRRENWTSRRFHTDYFNIEYLFWTWLTSFKIRHFKLSIHICLMYLRRVFAEIQVVLFTCLWRKVTETEPRQRTDPVYLLILEKHIISLLLWLYRKKRPLQIQMIPYSYLYDQNWQSIFSSFHEHKENTRQPAPVRASAPR